jgi:hypothetical protein
MKKKYFYEFSGNVFLEADDQAEAEKFVMGLTLDNYLLDEHLHEVDENYISLDLQKRTEQWGSDLHPLNDQDEFYEFKVRECRYGNIFKDFLQGKFDKNELMKRMDDAEHDDLDDCALVDEISMIDLRNKEMKTVRHLFVD